MKNRKALLVAIVIIALTCIILFFGKEKIYNNYVENIKYDIKISRYQTKDPGGLISYSTYRLIDINSKKLYIVDDTHIYGDSKENGHKYNVKTKTLTDEQIEKVKLLYHKETETTKRNIGYWIITMKDKKIILNELPFEDDLWNN